MDMETLTLTLEIIGILLLIALAAFGSIRIRKIQTDGLGRYQVAMGFESDSVELRCGSILTPVFYGGTSDTVFSSSDSDVADITNQGVVHGRRPGHTTICAKNANGIFTCHVIVK